MIPLDDIATLRVDDGLPFVPAAKPYPTVLFAEPEMGALDFVSEDGRRARLHMQTFRSADNIAFLWVIGLGTRRWFVRPLTTTEC